MTFPWSLRWPKTPGSTNLLAQNNARCTLPNGLGEQDQITIHLTNKVTGAPWTWFVGDPATATGGWDLVAVLTHELGHSINIGDNPAAYGTMV